MCDAINVFFLGMFPSLPSPRCNGGVLGNIACSTAIVLNLYPSAGVMLLGVGLLST